MRTTNNNLKIRINAEFNYPGLSTISYNNLIVYFFDFKYYEKQDTNEIINSVLKLSRFKDTKLNSITIDLLESDKQYNEQIIDSFRLVSRSGRLIYDRIDIPTKTYNFDVDSKDIDSIKSFLSRYLDLINDIAFTIYIDSKIN